MKAGLLLLLALVAVAAVSAAASAESGELVDSGAGVSRKLAAYVIQPGYANPGVGVLLPIETDNDDGDDSGGGGEAKPFYVLLFESFTGLLGDVLEVAGDVLSETVFD